MIELYDGNLQFLGPVDHVVKWGFELKDNDLSTATITLPAGDEINAQIVVPASFARLYDGDDDLGFYRFSAILSEEHAPCGVITYQLQSAQCTLLDSMLTGWHEVGGAGYNTRQVFEYILARQTVKRWVLGVCEFTDSYQYNFEDVTLLEAIMSLGEVVLGDYQFVFDSTASPWTVHMLRVSGQAYCSLVYGRNMTAIKRSVDGRVVTRLYGRGYGEGDNQMTIASVNGGRDYIDADAASIARWGIREGVHVDTRQMDPATLKARMEQILAAGSEPSISYETDAIDLYKLTGQSWDNVKCGARVLVLDEALGLPVTVKVTSRKKDDVEGSPGAVSYVLDNSRPDTAEELNEILEKIGVHELYSQGATNMYSMQISDNADASHPLVMRFYVPGNVLRINSCLICWQMEAFRTYATLAKAGGSSASTSLEAGGATVTLPTRVTTNDVFTSAPNSGRADIPIEDTSMMYATDGSTDITLSTGAATGNTGVGGQQATGGAHNAEGAMLNTASATAGGTVVDSRVSTAYTTPTAADHRHLHTMTHGHDFSGSGHTHGMSHWHQQYGHEHDLGKHKHSIPDHVHKFWHMHDASVSLTIPAMSFKLEGHRHVVNLPAHTHELEYGVYESGRAGSVSLIVDGETVPASAIGDTRELDVARYLRKNDDGKVTRSAWHEVEFVPDGLTRITADLFFQVFIQSRGAGDY